MKTRNFQKPLLAVATVVLTILAGNAVAQDATTSNAAQTAASRSAPPQLSYGVPQILQLAQAKVGDDTIIAYIQNSGTIYALDASQIVYLRQQGVSDRVVTAMLNQRKNITASAAQTASQPSTTATAQNNNSSDASDAQTSTAVAQPTVTYVQTVPSSSVYVIPDTQTYNYDAYYYQPYYYPYYAWPYPAVSFSFGGRWGGGYYHGGGFHGGGHGGWHR